MNTLPEGREREVAPESFRGLIGAAFGCLTVNYGHI